jgi:hypothetical protein
MHQCHFHPDKPLERKMTAAQEALLRRVVATNGGGVSAYDVPDSTLAGLVKRHLVQSKSVASYTIVHTREGLEWVRANPQ